MFWNGFTDIFWTAPSFLFDPLLLFLWLIFTFINRKQIKALSFIWFLGLSVLLNNSLQFSHFSDLINRSVLLQSESHSQLIQFTGLLSNFITSIGWGMFLWKLLSSNPHRKYWMLLFVLCSVPVLFFWTPAMLFFNGLLVVTFILRAKERMPFQWFVIAQFVSVSLAVFQLFSWFISFSPGGKI
jgi:hypothetical protein